MSKKEKMENKEQDKLTNKEELENSEKNENENENKEEEQLTEEISEAEEKNEELEKELQSWKDKALRKAAEFENYKRRTENDQMNLIKYSAESLLLKLLPVVDDFERSLDHMDNAKDVDSVKKGVELVYNKLIKVLEDEGVQKMDSKGKPFNVDYHEALMQRKDEKADPHTVLDVIEKGYLYKDKVLRHAKVVVSEELTEDENSGEIESNNENNSNEKE